MDKSKILLLETERKRIAKELHDTTIQDMVCLSQQLELMLLYIDKDADQAKLEAVAARGQIRHMIKDMRETIYDLHPMIIDDSGWHSAFDQLKDKMLYNAADLNVCFDIDMIDISDGVTAVSIYRIICEGCQNIVKHAHATNVKVSLKNMGNYILINICDDGVGIEEREFFRKNHFGLPFMRELVETLSGIMEIMSDDSGTVIKIKIPIVRRVKEA